MGQEVKLQNEDWLKILEAWKLILSVCDGAISRDEQGFDLFDAGTMRFFCHPDLFGVEGITPEEVEFVRRKLLRYREQLKKLGYKHFDVLGRPFHDVCFFAKAEDWEGNVLRVSPYSIRDHLPFIYEYLKNHDGWVRIYIEFKEGQHPKIWWISIRFNDLHFDGKTRKWWEGHEDFRERLLQRVQQ